MKGICVFPSLVSQALQGQGRSNHCYSQLSMPLFLACEYFLILSRFYVTDPQGFINKFICPWQQTAAGLKKQTVACSCFSLLFAQHLIWTNHRLQGRLWDKFYCNCKSMFNCFYFLALKNVASVKGRLWTFFSLCRLVSNNINPIVFYL